MIRDNHKDKNLVRHPSDHLLSVHHCHRNPTIALKCLTRKKHGENTAKTGQIERYCEPIEKARYFCAKFIYS